MKASQKTLLALIMAALAVAAGCQTVPYQGQARAVKMKPQAGGIIALAAKYRPEDRTVAEEKMKANCGNLPIRIIEEGEVAVGQKTSTDGSTTKRDSTKAQVGTLFGMPITSGLNGGTDNSSVATTTSITEWQISYECGEAAKTLKR